MKVALDARPLQNESGARGVGRYVRELIHALPAAGAELVLLESRWGRPEAAERRSPAKTIRLARPSRAITLFDQVATPLLCAREGFDVFHSTFYALPRLSVSRTRAVLTVHDLIPLLRQGLTSRKNTAIFGAIYRSARVADAVIVPSARTARDLGARIGVDPSRVHVVPMGVGAPFTSAPEGEGAPRAGSDSEGVRAPSGTGAPPGPFARARARGSRVLLYVGGFGPSKNVPFLFDALARFAGADVRLAIAGDPGRSAQDLREAAGRAGVGERVDWLGRLSEEDLAAAYRAADLFVTASLYEGFGLPALEAMACGCPVVALRAGIVPEVLDGAACGVAEPDEATFARAIEGLLSDTVERTDLARRGLARAAELSWTRTARETLAVYRQIVDEDRRTSSERRA